jgi:hypothetical protein
LEEVGRTNACPHDTECQPFLLDEPLVEVEYCWCVEEAAADGIEDALGEDEMPDFGGETGADEGDGRYD